MDELFSLVVHYKIVYLFLAIATLKDWGIYNFDVKTAYLYSDLDKEIYMEQPRSFKYHILSDIYTLSTLLAQIILYSNHPST